MCIYAAARLLTLRCLKACFRLKQCAVFFCELPCYCESFNSKLRDEFLNGEIFYSLKEVQVLAERWRVHYNTIRPHSSLGYRSPAPETWQPEVKTGYGEVESKVRFPLPHTLDGDEILTKLVALH
jgi:putative transposase